MIPPLDNWKYSRKTKRHSFATVYCKYQIGQNKKDGIFMWYKKLKLYDSVWHPRCKSFIFRNLLDLDVALSKACDIEKSEEHAHAKKLIDKARNRQRDKARCQDLLGSICNKCKNDDRRVLQFHHVDSSHKKSFSTKNEASLREVYLHSERFLLLCANCHIIEHSVMHSANRRAKFIASLN